jgi:hypothetical protein
MGSPMDLGKERFRWLLAQRGLRFTPEEDLERVTTIERTKPDFLVSPPGFPRFLVEVEGFEKPGPLAKRTARSYCGSGEESLPRLRTAVAHAAQQLKPYRALGIPMLVVLDNARRVGLSLQKSDLWNLFGSQEIRVPIDVQIGGQIGPWSMEGSSGSFHILSPGCNQHVSAVAVNMPRDRFRYDESEEQERPMRLRIVYNHYADIPFPPALFNDPEDEHIWWRDGRWDVRRG